MALPIIAIAGALAQFAPTVLKYLGVGEANVSVAESVIDIAKQVTGINDVDLLPEAFAKNAELAHAFKLKIAEQEHELVRLYYKDVENARARDVEIVKSGKANNRANWMTVLAIVVVVLLCIAVWSRPEVNDYVKGIITLVLGRFLGYLDQIFNFEFGTTRSSKEKDHIISNLSK